MTSTLLKNGTALLHDDLSHVKGVKADILIEGNKIVKIGADIAADASFEVVDCTDKIISPGFVDTHHHLWQTQLKGRHADETLIEYMTTGNWQSSNFTDADFYWGQLGGSMEAIWAGTTTVVDHAHLNCRPESSPLAISATASSGLRCVFAYCPIVRLNKWNPVELNYNILEPWVMETFDKLAKAGPLGDGRVTLGFAWDLYFLPKEVTTDIFQKVKALGVKTITSHFLGTTIFGRQSMPEMLESYGLLDDTILLSHANGSSARDAELLRKANAHFSSTPSTELQMAHGMPECWREDMQSQASLGIDCHSNQLGSVVSEMRIGLQAGRGISNATFEAQNKVPRKVFRTVEQAFNLGTIQGARALRMEDSIGSLKEGKLADLVIFDTASPGMVCAAEQDPVAAVVLHSSPEDVEAVMVDGIWRKRNSKLLPVNVEAEAQAVVGKASLEWIDVAKALRESRKVIQQKIDELDFEQADRMLKETYRIDQTKIVDSL